MSDEVLPEVERPNFFVRAMPFATAFVMVILLAILVLIVPKFEVMFKEMAIGDLPIATKLVLLVANTAVQYWYALPFVAALAIWGVTKAPKDRSTTFALYSGMLLVMGLFVALLVLALFMPLLTIMEKIGK